MTGGGEEGADKEKRDDTEKEENSPNIVKDKDKDGRRMRNERSKGGR